MIDYRTKLLHGAAVGSDILPVAHGEFAVRMSDMTGWSGKENGS